MKAALLADYGSADNFSIVDVPKPGVAPGEVLVRVAYAGLRWGDIMSRNGLPARLVEPPFVPGQEVAGVVEAVGAGVEGFAEGDRVVAQPMVGGYAEYVSVPARSVGKVLDGVPLETMLVYRVNLPTAYLAVFEWAKVQDGESVVVHAAAGGVGMLAVQLLKRRLEGVTVIGIVGSDEKAELARRHGADHAINRHTHDYVAEVGEIAGVKPRGFAPWAPPAGVDVVLNGVGGPTLRTDRRIIRRLGRWVLFGTVAGVEPVNLFESSYDSITILPFSMIPFHGTAAMRRANEFVSDWLLHEELVAPSVQPIEDIADVQKAMEAGDTAGKVVFAL
jgi:NADPH:quinone reductase-like Zn-dependent oxidoreductase